MKRVRGPLKSQVASMQNSPDNVSPPEEQKQEVVETHDATATTTTTMPTQQLEEEKKSVAEVQDNRDRLTQQKILKYLKN